MTDIAELIERLETGVTVYADTGEYEIATAEALMSEAAGALTAMQAKNERLKDDAAFAEEQAAGYDALEQDRDECRNSVKFYAAQFLRVTAERDAALAQVERLREALRPFAQFADGLSSTAKDGVIVPAGFCLGNFRIAHFAFYDTAPAAQEPDHG